LTTALPNPDDLLPRLSPADIAKAARAHFGEDVERISAPGGRSRDSVRVTLTNRSIIATQRPTRRAFEMERALLERLSQAGGPVPRFLGHQGTLLFQEDAGRQRLSVQLAKAPLSRAREIAQGAFESLWHLKSVASETGLTQNLPVLALSNDWLTPFCNMPATLSRTLDLAPPQLDIEALVGAVVLPPDQFVKWDARSGNAALNPTGRVIWFDWEHAGRRGGAEDFAFLAGDEFWPLGADATLELFARTGPGVTPTMMRFLTCFTTLQITQRLEMILGRVQRKGWTDADRALRYDKIGAAPEMLERLGAHGADWASRDSRVKPLVEWFQRITQAIADQADTQP
jgi:hypothetical protein